MPRRLISAKLLLGLAAAAFVPLAGCDVDVKDEGKLPDVDVDVQTEPGKAPDVDVHGPDVDVGTKEETVTVPTDVDVKTEKKKITVPDIDVNVPDENDNEPPAENNNP